MMRNLFAKSALLAAIVAFGAGMFASCDDDVTYADLLKRQNKQIEAFLKKGCVVTDPESGDTLLYVAPDIKPISEMRFAAQDSTTNVAENEYVLFNNSGIYMQIVRKGPGSRLAEGARDVEVVMRYYEFNIAGDSIQTTNRVMAYENYPDIMTVYNTSGTIGGTFVSGIMKTMYGSPSVPSAWLKPLSYINLGRQDAPDAEIAKVRLIVPAEQGQSDASNNIYPCFYEITYQRGW